MLSSQNAQYLSTRKNAPKIVKSCARDATSAKALTDRPVNVLPDRHAQALTDRPATVLPDRHANKWYSKKFGNSIGT